MNTAGAAQKSVSRASIVIAAVSTIVEWYDFTLYLYFSTVLSRVFFGGGQTALLAIDVRITAHRIARRRSGDHEVAVCGYVPAETVVGGAESRAGLEQLARIGHERVRAQCREQHDEQQSALKRHAPAGASFEAHCAIPRTVNRA